METRGRNEYDHLILKYDEKAKRYVDITKDVFFLKEENNSWRVGFSSSNNGGKYYNFKLRDIIVSKNPEKLAFDRKNVYINKKRNFDVTNIFKFGKYGYKIFFKDSPSLYIDKISINDGRVEIDVVDLNISKTGNKVFDYYKALAKYAADISLDESSIEHLLFNLYRKINTINDDSVLDSYTNQDYGLKNNEVKTFIYPFSTNLSQMMAIEQVFRNKLSVISGPPGTGKTQVILNLIANAVTNNMSVAVISNNNTAVENVYDKMKEEDLEYLLAYLGNSDNIDKFFSNRDNLQERVSNINELCNKTLVSNLASKLKSLYKANNDKVKLSKELFELKEEYKHFKDKHEYKEYSSIISDYKDYNQYFELKYFLLSLDKIGFFKRLKLKRKYKLDINKVDSLDEFITYLEYKYYESKITTLTSELDKVNKFIKENEFGELTSKLKKESRIMFDNYLIRRYRGKGSIAFNKDNYKDKFNEFVKRYPVILSTTHSLLRNIPYWYMFDLVIIDEASQSDILTSIITMNVAKQMVVVGDDKQLSQIDNQEIYDASEELEKNYNISKCYTYKDNSILQSVLALPNKVDTIILREHYRCDSRIIEFCNKKFYDNKLIVCTKTSDDDPLFVLHTVEGNHARKNPNGSGQYNDREAQEILEIVKENDSKDIGIITPFRAQADYIYNLTKDDYPNIEVDTIHKYQGRQKEVIILSTVVNDLNVEDDDFVTDFVTNAKLLNVAISRAVKKLYLVVSDKVYNSSNNTIAQFIDYIKYYCNDTSISEGKVVSIFDELYHDQESIMKESKCAKYVDSYAEEIMLDLLRRVLIDYPDYKIVMHYRLSDLLNNYSGFDSDEVRYIKHPKTHVDFVIFDKVSLKPVLCIEVDGTRYHDYAKVQIEHDKIKTRVLESNGINILRLKTNQSGEEARIRKYL